MGLVEASALHFTVVIIFQGAHFYVQLWTSRGIPQPPSLQMIPGRVLKLQASGLLAAVSWKEPWARIMTSMS